MIKINNNNLNIYLYLTIGIIVGLFLGLVTVPNESEVGKYVNDTEISVMNATNLPVKPSLVNPEIMGSSILWSQLGSGNQNLQQGVTGVDQLIGNTDIQTR